ncbi:hypothetical protein EB796_007566 [Bugula neritina]|uniref:Uncharacterized protein n=1 Tax=Bugula neritina TaxID=10212 RepID=A0A7J7K938_BUGNE|nr:hypothetical protein EB796_007566 [Bugula neritina]
MILSCCKRACCDDVPSVVVIVAMTTVTTTITVTNCELCLIIYASLVDAATDQLHSSVKSQLTQVADDQRSLSMDYWEKQSCEMSARLEATLESSMTSHRESLDTYLAERVQRDKEVQRRNLAAVGVYLEAASKHITTLMDS